jgi:signal transduction histidine kinase
MAANREWVITVVHMEGRWDINMVFIILGGVIIMLAAVALAVYVRNDARKTKRYNELKQQASHEKAALTLKNARQATKTERELNDFIAHEVRNPVAAAMAACNFVQMEMNKTKPFVDEEALVVAQGDMSVIENALKFVNDLLRNMLDMHRAGNKQLQVEMVATDLMHDVIEPVAGMLHKRGSKVEVIVECPENLWINADPLRLKQVILNLGRNSSKFIEEGFIRIKAEEVDGNVKLYVDDSGSGIPPEKRDRIFAKFQESLDVLSQGTVSTFQQNVSRVENDDSLIK